jgi:hypothetical protein
LEDWQVFFDDGASIAEFDGGLSGADAEARRFRKAKAVAALANMGLRTINLEQL